MNAQKAQPTLGFGVITRNKDREGLLKLLDSVKGHVDAIYITVADKEAPDADMEKLAIEYGAVLSEFRWCNDFAAARNFNMEGCKEDWYVWGDTDDEIRGMDKARALIKNVAPNTQFIIAEYIYSKTSTGATGTTHPKERFIRNNGLCKWKGKLHESCVSDGPTNGVMAADIVWVQTKTGEQMVASTKRNVEIIEAEIAEQVEAKAVDPRTVFNLGMAYASIAQSTHIPDDWDRARRAFLKYVEMSGWDQHAYMAWKYIGVAEMNLNKPMDAFHSFVEAWKLQPGYADAYSMLGQAWERLNKVDNAEAMYRAALLLGKQNAYAADIETSKLVPLYGLAKIYALRGKLDDSLQLIKESEKYVGKGDVNFSSLKSEIKKIKKFNAEAVDAVISLKKLPEPKQQAAFQKLEQRFKSHPEVIKWRQSKNWKKETSGREISIYAYAWEEWTPDSAKTGIGGSEEAIIYVTRDLKRLGYEVHVYGQHGTEAKEYDGIWYHPYWEWSPSEPTDIFISWRNPDILDLEITAKKKYLWLHDTTPESAVLARLDRVDKVFVLSGAHMDLYPNVPKGKLMLSANGIIPEHFMSQEAGLKRNRHQLAYVSAPDRGLGCLLELWPRIKEKVPDAEFYWAYGWNSFDKIQSNNPNAMAFKAELQKMLKQPGCHELGRIGHTEVAKLLLESGVWGYPTEFYEIFCISAVKAQAAGAIPVCTTVAALGEVVQHGIRLDVKDLYTNEEKKTEFVEAVVKSMLEPNEDERQEMMDWARNSWTWAAVAEQWHEEFQAGKID